jgi:hypothetical protein
MKLRTRSDLALMRTSWVFDMNFISTWQHFMQRGDLKKLEDRMRKTLSVERALQTVQEFIQTKLISAPVCADGLTRDFLNKVMLSAK